MEKGFSLLRLEPVHEILIRDLPAAAAGRGRLLAGLARSPDPVLRASLGPGEAGQPCRVLLHDRASADVLRRLRERVRRLGAAWEHRADLAWLELGALPRAQAMATRCLGVLEDAGIEVREVALESGTLGLLLPQTHSARACTLLFEALATDARTDDTP